MTADKIKRIRQALNLTQTQAGALLGVHWITWNRWENGHTKPQKRDRASLEVLAKKAGLLEEVIEI